MAETTTTFCFRVRTDERIAGIPVAMLFVTCALSPTDAVARLRGGLPEAWEVELTELHLSDDLTEPLGLTPGEVRRLG